MAEVGRDLCVPLPNPCPSRDTQSRVPRATSRWSWEIPKEEIPHLWAACASAPSLHSTEGLLVFRGNLLRSSLCPWPLILAPGTTDRAWLQSLTSFLQVFMGTDNISLILHFSR